jgi:replicative DNA helicase
MEIEKIKSTIDKLDSKLQNKDEKERLLELKRKYTGSDEVISAKEYSDDVKKEKILYKAFSGLKKFDSIIEGFRPGTVVIISGPTKQGKTTFCQTLTKAFSSTGFECLWFSFDTPPYELIERFEPLPTFYLPRNNFPDKKIQWLEEKIIEGMAKYNTRMIFIDHLGSISRFTSETSNHATELTAIVRELKDIAMRWNVTIFLNHHIQKIDLMTTRPAWYHMKDSSGPGQEADITLMISKGMRLIDRKTNKFEYDGTGKISVELNRRGKTGIVDLLHEKNGFIEYEKQKEMEL